MILTTDVYMNAEDGEASVTREYTGDEARHVAYQLGVPFHRSSVVTATVTIQASGLDTGDSHAKIQEGGDDSQSEIWPR